MIFLIFWLRLVYLSKIKIVGTRKKTTTKPLSDVAASVWRLAHSHTKYVHILMREIFCIALWIRSCCCCNCKWSLTGALHSGALSLSHTINGHAFVSLRCVSKNRHKYWSWFLYGHRQIPLPPSCYRPLGRLVGSLLLSNIAYQCCCYCHYVVAAFIIMRCCCLKINSAARGIFFPISTLSRAFGEWWEVGRAGERSLVFSCVD